MLLQLALSLTFVSFILDTASCATPSPSQMVSAGVNQNSTDRKSWRCHITTGPLPGAPAAGTWSDDVEADGWGKLHIEAQGVHAAQPAVAAFAAGCIESYFTHTRMYQYWFNYAKAEYGSAMQPPTNLTHFMAANEEWVRKQASSKHDGAPTKPTSSLDDGNDEARFWAGADLVMAQFDGLVAGFAAYATEEEQALLTPAKLYMLNSVGDLETLNGLYKDRDGSDAASDAGGADAGGGAAARALGRPGDPPGPDLDRLDCSALITLVRDTTTTTNTTAEPNTTGRVGTVTDILAGHATWRSYYAMLRVYKVYAFAFLPARVVSLSSSPGLLHSKDDFYATPTLVVMETTNGIYDRSLYNPETIKPQTALSWQRAAIATGFGLNGSDWVNLFKRHNSGTYNNQWMVLDTAHFVPGGELPSAGLLYVAEQIPGKVQSADVTDVLAKQGYWPSYNIPYFKNIFKLSGYPKEVVARGASATYAKAPRAEIFGRSATSANTLDKFKALMRYNEFGSDAVCQQKGYGGGACAVAARGDLPVGEGGWLGGGVDAKVTAASLMVAADDASVEVHAACGPTHDAQPVFSWSVAGKNSSVAKATSHVGLPDAFDFDYVAIPSTFN